jgi:hypothetical protein
MGFGLDSDAHSPNEHWIFNYLKGIETVVLQSIL